MMRPCSGRGLAPSAAAKSENASRRPDCAGGERRKTAARASHAGCSTKLRASPVHGVSRIVPGCRNMSHGARAIAVAACSRLARGPSRTRKLQPATSATAAVSSREPASVTSTSLMRPAVAPGTSAPSVRTSARSELSVAMITLSIRYRSRRPVVLGSAVPVQTYGRGRAFPTLSGGGVSL
jgi:hypothetical protein